MVSITASSPGRVNLIGEHIDYSDGWVLPFAITERTTVRITTRDDSQIRIRSNQQSGEITLEVAALDPRNRRHDWSDYVAGTIWSLGVRSGLDIDVDGQVPLGAGLSSSAALECSIAFALNDLFKLGHDLKSLARSAQRAENEYVGMPCGIMDQAVSLMAEEGHALLLDCVDLTTRQIPFELAPAGLEILVIDTMAHHELTDGGYAERRDTCHRALRELGFTSMRDLDLATLESRKSELDDVGYRRIRHAVTEIARVHECVAALSRGDFAQVGSILDRSHLSLARDYEVSCVELDLAVEAVRKAGALGSRMVGGGFGGSAIALIDSSRIEGAKSEIAKAFDSAGLAQPRFFTAIPSEGARIEA